MLRRKKMQEEQEEVKQRSYYSIFYENKIKNNPEFYEKEKKRVVEYMRNRYANDEEYRNKIKEQKRLSYHKRKNLRMANNDLIQVS